MDVTVTGLGSASGALQLLYLDVPALARLEVVHGSRSRFHVLVGPEINLNLNSRVSFSQGGQSASQPIDNFPRTDYSLVTAGRFERGPRWSYLNSRCTETLVAAGVRPMCVLRRPLKRTCCTKNLCGDSSEGLTFVSPDALPLWLRY